ncbi:MAG TPA: PEPxxWA-CTERM sorting domain-containing protein [Sphingomonas sp.]|nr:PEPxxWA-CTERM sorting domain-containing protein [Sphingomonas sp.]
MKKWLLAAAAAVAIAAPASAGVITLASRTVNGPNDFTFTYQGTLGPDEGVTAGDRLIIYDFAGYIAGSIFSMIPTVTPTVEFTSPSGIVTPGFTDDPTLPNLVFTYTGPDFRTSGGPFPPFDFNGLGARSTFGGLNDDAFFGFSTKNNPDGIPGGTGTKIYSLGSVTVPAPAGVPEPATWAMMLGGFGVAGAFARRRKTAKAVLA